MADDDSDVQAAQLLGTTVEVQRVHHLCSAAYLGDLDEIHSIIKKGVNVNGKDYDGRTALHVASANGHFEAVQLLLRQSGIQIEAQV
jgi:ankyrin repeat protein